MLENALNILADQKNSLHMEKEELEDLKEELADYKEVYNIFHRFFPLPCCKHNIRYNRLLL